MSQPKRYVESPATLQFFDIFNFDEKMTEKKSKPQLGKRKIILGVAYLDIADAYNVDTITLLAHTAWYNMLQRCYYKKYHETHPTYIDCRVCDEWLLFSNFREWFKQNYVDGWCLDKDLLVQGNKIYSPETCCFLPKELNANFISRTRRKNRFGKGVSITPKGKYIAFIQKKGKTYNLGHYDTIQEAHDAYKNARIEYVREIADKYYKSGMMPRKVYDALYNYSPTFND